MIEFDCKMYVRIKKQYLKDEICNCNNMPGVAVIQIGNDAASNAYIRGKEKDCKEVGINFIKIHFDEEEVTTNDVINIINDLNNRDDINGIVVQLPLPESLDVKLIQNSISMNKDVDGFRNGSPFTPCTPKGIIDWLEYNDITFEGKNVVVVGRSNIVGKPLVNMFIDRRSTVTCCNSKTVNTKEHTKTADYIVTAIGCPRFFDRSYFSKHNRIIIDVGINKMDGYLCGDVDAESISKKYHNTYITPVPGGVGLLTRIALLENILIAYKLREEEADG